jgi:hypothetical protein
MLIIFLIIAVVYLFYKWSVSTFDYFEKQNFPFIKPVPLFGSNANLFINRKPFTEVLHKWFYDQKDEK